MITCSRCGKENQKHYKFCLGCGAKLEAPAPAAPAAESPRLTDPARAAEAPAAPSAMPRVTGAGTATGAGMAGAGSFPDPMSLTSPPTNAGVGPQSALDLPATTESPILNNGSSGARASAAMGAVAAAAPIAPASLDAAAFGGATARDRDHVPCPKCGKLVVATFAFCGACGNRMKPGAAPVAAAAPAAAPVARTMAPASSSASVRTAPRGHLTLIRPDGTEGGVHPLQDGENLIGRGQGSLFDADPYLSPRHAEFAFTDEGLIVRDLRSLNGVFVKIVAEERLESGDVLRIGQELLRFNVIAPPVPLEDGTDVIGTPNPGYWGRLSVIVGRDVEGPAFPLYDETVVLGRERGDILFPEDGYVSGRHAQISYRDGHATLTDLGSSNGTFFRIRGSRAVPPGTLLLMGQQLFRASYR